MTGRRSTLWRRLNATQPLFTVYNEDGLELSDHEITQISINRGADGPEWGIHTPTMTVDSIKYELVRTNERIRVDLTSYGTSLINSLTSASQAAIRPRFHGRIGKQTVEDLGPNRERTTYSCAGWEAQLKNLDIPVRPPVNSTVAALIVSLATTAGADQPEFPTWHWPAPAAYYGYVRGSSDPITYSESIDKWTKDLGLYVQTRRNGRNYILPHQYRWEKALEAMPNSMPLTRSQALSPATMEQPSESIPERQQVQWYINGEMNTVVWGEQWDNPNIKLVRNDMVHVDFRNNDEQPRRTGNALGRQARTDRYRLPALTFNLLYLITSKRQSHRDQARQLLELEPGDPVFLSGDWKWQLRGIYFASGIDEKISADGWEITLNLSTSRETVGYISPEIPARTWESAMTHWNEDSRKWDDA